MMKNLVKLSILLLFISQIHGQNNNNNAPILFIYDASGSMWGQLEGKTKKEIASEVLSNSVNALPQDQKIGLIAYGHRKKGDCSDVEFLVALENTSKTSINSAVKSINPLGKTPLAHAAKQAINTLKSKKERATIILITDGIESCNGKLCEVVSAAKEQGINFKLHIVGFGLKDEETEELKCAAAAGGGKYYTAANASGLGDVLTEATSQTIDKPKGNFSIYAIKNGNPVDSWVRAYKAGTKEDIDFTRTYRDTGFVHLPPGNYDIEVRPLEGTKISGTTFNIDIKEGEIQHKTISFDGGSLNVMVLNNDIGWDATTRVFNQDGKVVGVGRTYGKPKLVELDVGVYDVEVMALRMKGLDVKKRIENVVVEAGKTVDLTHNFKSGIAKLGVEENGTLVDVTVGIMTPDKKTAITGGRSYTQPSSNPREFILNPGKYAVRLRGRKNGKDTIKWFDIIVTEGKTFTKMYEW